MLNVAEVQFVVVQVSHHIDRKRWRELRALYAAEVESDYTSLFGGEPVRQSGDALIAGWQQALSQVTTQHLLGPIEVYSDGPRADASCHVRALHYAAGLPGGEYWEVLGHYLFSLTLGERGWAIGRMKLETLLQTGNRQFLAEVAAQAPSR